MDGWTYNYTNDPDGWEHGVFEDKEELIKEVNNTHCDLYDCYYLAKARWVTQDLIIDTEYGIECALEGLEAPESAIDDFCPSNEDLHLLQRMVDKVVDEWQKKTDNMIKYYQVYDVERVSFNEYE